MSIDQDLLTRREAIRRVSAALGGVAFVGGSGLLAACERARAISDTSPGAFTAGDVAFLDEIADTILPTTKTPGAKAAKTGAFMALMVTDSYSPAEQRVFRDGMKKVDAASKKANKVAFMSATPQQRLAVLTVLDREQKAAMDAREAADRKKKGLAPVRVDAVAAKAGAAKADAFLPDERKENAPGAADVSAAPAISADEPPHYFRMMKELALLGYFTSQIGCTQAMRYVESPGRFDPCTTYKPGEPAWAPHA
ncbi:MAG: hypothetical protein JWM41_1820 [Gemmatimonadetes bacterium]|nr:hypothetical protein [Gemmatimonadota bacterium]